MFQTFEAPPNNSTALTADRISQLRNLMSSSGLSAYIVPRADAFQGEYVAACDERLAWLTGFTGSAGVAIIATSRAALIVDGRYKLQARDQAEPAGLDIVEFTPTAVETWLKQNLSRGDTVGVDPWLATLNQSRQWLAALEPAGIVLSPLEANLVDMIWGNNRPKPPLDPVSVHPLEFAGRSADDKIQELQEKLRSDGDDASILTSPDSICWLLNVRGRDVPHTPIARMFAIVPANGKVALFIATEKVRGDTRPYLGSLADIHEPEALADYLADLKSRNARTRIDPARASWWFAQRLNKSQIHRATDPCVLAKAIKNDTEIQGARSAQHRDATAIARFLAWLDREAGSGEIDEIGAAKRLEEYRSDTNLLEDISFDTISGSGPNGAIVHYRVTDATNRKLGPGELYLVDSGGQYRDGTTDITRTIAIGTPTPEMRRHATLVLKAHIAIATARFPKGTRGIDLDPLARAPLWHHGLDFDHGTGHGIGSFLSVHEGPQSISKRGMHTIEPGMIISNEPGYYREGAYGIRLENLVLVRDAEPIEGGDRDMMSFETLTLAPFDRNLIDPVMLSGAELDWLNAYHHRVAEEVGPHVDEETRAWLIAACAPF